MLNTFFSVFPLTEHPYLLTLDSLILSLETDEYTPGLTSSFIQETYPIANGFHHLAQDVALKPTRLPKQDGCGSFKRGFVVYVLGQEIGYLRTDPHRVSPEHVELVSFTFANWTFYTCTGWYQYYELLRTVLRIQIRSISYCEIAMDSNATRLVYLDGMFYDSSLAQRRDTAPRYISISPRLHAQPNGRGGYHFGNPAHGGRGHGKQVVAYDKSREIAENGKDYISDCHKLNGLDVSMRWSS